MYLLEYPKKKNFPKSVYKAAYGLVEYATNQFEENTKQIEELIRQREANIALAAQLRDVLNAVERKDKDWKERIKDISDDYPDDIIDTLSLIGRCRTTNSENYKDAVKLINARISNLESNLHIEIDMERIEDRSKALSYIGIEIAESLKVIPAPLDMVEEESSDVLVDTENYLNETRLDVIPSLWDRVKNSKLVRAFSYIFKIRIKLDLPSALPEGRGDNH